MNELLTSVKEDLTDRRLLPLVALVALALVAGLVYALAAGGGSGAPAPLAAPSPASAVPPGIAVAVATPEKAVAETTDGVKEQQRGSAHDPFALLPGSGASSSAASVAASGAAAKAAAGSASTTSSSSSSSSASGSGSAGSKLPAKEESKPAAENKQTKKPVYHVAILFGPFPPGAKPETVTLTPYANLKLQTPLPNAKQPLIVFRGVTSFGGSATFTIVGETILHGQGACLPSPSQCQALDLKPGQTEQLEYLQPNGETSVYELRVASIEKVAASAASVQGAKGWESSREGAELLRKDGLVGLPYLRYSSIPGLLVFAPPRAKSARAHAALVRWRISRVW